MGKKLVALNLALIIIAGLLFGTPSAYAIDEEKHDEGSYIQAQGTAAEDKDENLNIPASGDQTASVMAGEPYIITVNGTSFYSNMNSSGTGWNYDSSYGVLDLTNYSGSSITTSGDLIIYSSGNVNVTGSSGSYGANAITVSGALDFFVMSGTTTLQGGTGTVYGGHGMNASALRVFAFNNTANFICSGGTGTSIGGYGLFGNDISLSLNHATITGGNSSSNAGYGIVYLSSLYVGVGNITVQAGSTSVGAIVTQQGGPPFYYSIYNDIINQGYRISFSPKVFSLTLNGAGGTYNGSASTSISAPYPAATYLGDYVFTRSGYKQIGWTRTTASGTDLIAIGDTYTPTSNTTLNAQWVQTNSNSVLFVGNGGLINGSHYWLTTTGSSVGVPSRSQAIKTDTFGSNLYLLGWTTKLKLSSDLNNILNFGYQWYLPGSSVGIGNQTTAYAHWTSYGNIISYDGNGGQNGSGSPATIQAILSSDSNMTLYVQNDLGFQKSGYTFTGWKDGSGNLYASGRVILPSSDLTVTNLTAQWAQNFTIYFDGNGGLYNSLPSSSAPTYEGKTQSLSIYNFQKQGFDLLGWNTERDGSGTGFSVAESITITGDVHLYAQWGTSYYGHSTDLKDTITCMVIPGQNKVNITLAVTSLKNTTMDSQSLPVYYGLYQGGRLVSLIFKNVPLADNGMNDYSAVYYPSGVQPDSCKVFILNATGYTPAGPPIACLFQ